MLSGFNKYKHDAGVLGKEGASRHAEQVALYGIDQFTRGVCVSVRVGRPPSLQNACDSDPVVNRLAAPCDDCMRLLARVGVRKVVYSNPASFTGFSMLRL